ncbi:TFIIH complex serine/threonine-protein kinase subunit kin28, partial [Podochytrium sp. JEL0797]
MERYQKLGKIGEGTFATVYKGVTIDSKRLVAIKKIKLGKFTDGLEVTTIREIMFLKELKHSNVVE